MATNYSYLDSTTLQQLLTETQDSLRILMQQKAAFGIGHEPLHLLKSIAKQEALYAALSAELERRQTPLPPTISPPPPPPTPRLSAECPFSYGSTVPPKAFYGRHEQRQRIKQYIGNANPMCVSLVGIRRSGKSSLLRYITERTDEFCPQHAVILTFLSLQDIRYQTPSGIYEGLRRSIEQATGTAPWAEADNANPWHIESGLEQIRQAGYRLIIIIDEFEHIATRLNEFQAWGEDWRNKASLGYFTLLLASNHALNEIYQRCGLTSPFKNIFTTVVLGAFQPYEWQQLVRDGFLHQNYSVTDADIELIDDLAGGIPYYTQLAAALLWQSRDHEYVREEFEFQAAPLLTDLWDSLSAVDQRALAHLLSKQALPAPRPGTIKSLQRYGILQPNGQLFSSTFAQIIKERL